MNMRLAGYNDLQGRSAYQPTIHHQGNRSVCIANGTGKIVREVKVASEPGVLAVC